MESLKVGDQPEQKENPLLAALPPATDYLSYLTLVEYNLSKENLPTLHEVLQDSKLTINIGWDLVHLLLPLLPESETCLDDIARLGNPREVILKVTEALRLLDFDTVKQETDDDDPSEAAAKDPTSSAEVASSSKAGQAVPDLREKLPLPVAQFQSLLSMLSILHPRIKTKLPSRFLSTTLQAVLASYNNADAYQLELTESVLKFIKTISGTKRPHFPPRTSSGFMQNHPPRDLATDPEANTETPTKDEDGIFQRLLQSFLTHIMEDYVLSLSSTHDLPGLCWSSRIEETIHSDRVFSGKESYTERFASQPNLKDRSLIIGQFVALARDLRVESRDLYNCIIDSTEEASGLPGKEDDPPETAKDIPFSKAGSLILYTARRVAEVLYNSQPSRPPLPIFPDHAALLQNFIGGDMSVGVGMEPEALIDTVLALGLIAVEKDAIEEPEDDDGFTQYLQMTSLLSANTPSPSLRYLAHYLTSTVLRSHPSDVIRLSFIRDTLEHCPYENLKASAVSWLKGEIIEANVPKSRESEAPNVEGLQITVPSSAGDAGPRSPGLSIFATPVALSTTSSLLFPDLTRDLTAPSIQEAYNTFKTNLSFYLATLNFYFLLLIARHMHEPLDLEGFHQEADIGGSYIGPLRAASARFTQALQEGGDLVEEEGEEGCKKGLMELEILGNTLDKVEEGVTRLNKA